jgi:hypothetical protein
MTTKGYIIGSAIIVSVFLLITLSAASWANKTADQNQNRIDSVFSILDK